MENNQIVITESSMETSIKNITDRAMKSKVFNAVENADASVGESLNQEIDMIHWIKDWTEQLNEETGELETVPLWIIIDKDWKAYATSSKVVGRAMKRLIAMYGDEDLEKEPLKIKFMQEGTGKNKFNTLKLV
ncbi:hypothetical protein [Bacillus altitudinis]|uniref:hypothetical protein n=1 Tax=Bacillus altitudinis TaxID=293387 RepID=UPI003D211AAE